MAQKYIAPVPQGTSRGFGNGHNGIDYLTQIGTPVRASGDGVVVFEGWGEKHSWITWMGGIAVLIRHDDGHTGYAHLKSTSVNAGQTVKQGEVIGYSGNTGNVLPKPTPQSPAAGSHLHFEFLPLVPNFQNGYAGRVDPSGYFGKQINVVTPQGGDMEDIITDKHKYLIRVINSEVKGWNREEVHSGKMDENEMKAWKGKKISAFSQQSWDEGGNYRALKDKWKAAFDREPGYKKQIADLEKRIRELESPEAGEFIRVSDIYIKK